MRGDGRHHDASLQQFCRDVQKHAVLSREQELQLARQYRADACEQAAHKLVVHNLRFVLKIAQEYRGYGIRGIDLVQEGNLGLMIAVKKFDPERGYRLVSYAVWWIRAYIQAYIMRTWSLVKVGTTQAQRKLFFRLRGERERLERNMPPGEHVGAAMLAATLGVDEQEVQDMSQRLGERDFSLDAAREANLRGGDQASPEQQLGEREQLRLLRQTLATTLPTLNDNEQAVTRQRILAEEPPTLDALGKVMGISRERVRQIQAEVTRKIRAAMQADEPAA